MCVMITWHDTMSCFSVLQVFIQKFLHFACYIRLIGLITLLKIVIRRIKFFLSDKEKIYYILFLFLKVQIFFNTNLRKSVGTGLILHANKKYGRWCS